jgi:hypothetical protein
MELEGQFQAARPHLIQIIRSEGATNQFVQSLLTDYDDQTTYNITTVHFSRGYVRVQVYS